MLFLDIVAIDANLIYYFKYSLNDL